MNIVIGLLMFAIGVALILKAEWFYQNFGTIEWAEAHLAGGSRLMYKLVGTALILLGLLTATGAIGGIITAIFVPTR